MVVLRFVRVGVLLGQRIVQAGDHNAGVFRDALFHCDAAVLFSEETLQYLVPFRELFQGELDLWPMVSQWVLFQIVKSECLEVAYAQRDRAYRWGERIRIPERLLHRSHGDALTYFRFIEIHTSAFLFNQKACIREKRINETTTRGTAFKLDFLGRILYAKRLKQIDPEQLGLLLLIPAAHPTLSEFLDGIRHVLLLFTVGFPIVSHTDLMDGPAMSILVFHKWGDGLMVQSPPG